VADWDPAEHPRDPRNGEFVETPGGGWVGAVAAAIGGIPTRREHGVAPHVADRYSRALREQLRVSHEEEHVPVSMQGQAAYDRNHEFYQAQAALRGAYGEPETPKVAQHQLHIEVQRDYYRDWYRRRNHPDLTVEQMHAQAAGWARQAFAGRQVAIRTTPGGLSKILEEGRFRTVHDQDTRSRGLNDSGFRAIHEEATWGPGANPVYGYLAGDDRHARKDNLDDALSQYGRVEIRLKNDVRPRTTAMFGDSLDVKHAGRPSPVDNPDGWAWTYANPGGIVTHRLSGVPDARDPDDEGFQGSTGYIEAQIHGGVTTGDIERVVFPSPPSAALKAALAAAGIPWKVVKP
jgi:hypothetical protein